MISKAIGVKRKNVPHSLKAFMHTDVQESVKADDWVFLKFVFAYHWQYILIILDTLKRWTVSPRFFRMFGLSNWYGKIWRKNNRLWLNSIFMDLQIEAFSTLHRYKYLHDQEWTKFWEHEWNCLTVGYFLVKILR